MCELFIGDIVSGFNLLLHHIKINILKLDSYYQQGKIMCCICCSQSHWFLSISVRLHVALEAALLIEAPAADVAAVRFLPGVNS